MVKEIEFNGMLTKDEFRALCEAVRRNGQIDEAEVTKLVNWVIERRTEAECANLIIEGYLIVDGWQDNTPQLLPPAEIINAISSLDFTQPMLEETRC